VSYRKIRESSAESTRLNTTGFAADAGASGLLPDCNNAADAKSIAGIIKISNFETLISLCLFQQTQ